MNDRRKAPVLAVIASVIVALAGAFMILVTCQAFYCALIKHMRVLFPFLYSPAIVVVGLWWLITPWMTIRHYGRGARMNLIISTTIVGAVIASCALPLLIN